MVDRPLGETPVFVRFTSRHAGQDLDPLLNGLDTPDVEQPLLTASTTSSFSIRWRSLALGIMTPWVPVSPLALQTAKKPSILKLTPPIGWILPRWLTLPVTAIPCLIGTPDRADSRAYSSVDEALSPSMPS